jgi:hypothetical protein
MHHLNNRVHKQKIVQCSWSFLPDIIIEKEDGEPLWFNGKIGEVIMFKENLEDQQLQVIEDKLIKKWGILPE